MEVTMSQQEKTVKAAEYSSAIIDSIIQNCLIVSGQNAFCVKAVNAVTDFAIVFVNGFLWMLSLSYH